MVLSDNIYDLIVRKQLNKLTPEEEGQLQDWLNESDQNQEEVKRIVELLQNTKRLYACSEPDLEKCYQEFVRTYNRVGKGRCVFSSNMLRYSCCLWHWECGCTMNSMN